MSNIFEKLRGDVSDETDPVEEEPSQSPPVTTSVLAIDPSKLAYTRGELLALHKPDYNTPSDFTFISGFTSPESLPPVAVEPDLYNQERTEQEQHFRPGGFHRGGRGGGAPGGRFSNNRGGGGGRFAENRAGGRRWDREGDQDGGWEDPRDKKRTSDLWDDPRDTPSSNWRTERKKPLPDQYDRTSDRPADQLSSSQNDTQPPASKAPVGSGALSASDDKVRISLDTKKWWYTDPQGELQGPFVGSEMNSWLLLGYFRVDLMVKRGEKNALTHLGKLFLNDQQNPFNGMALNDFYAEEPRFHPFKQQLLQLQISLGKPPLPTAAATKPEPTTGVAPGAIHPLLGIPQPTTLKMEDLLGGKAAAPAPAAPPAANTPAVNIWNTTGVWGTGGKPASGPAPTQPTAAPKATPATTGATATPSAADNINPQLQQQYNMLQMNYNMLQLQQAQNPSTAKAPATADPSIQRKGVFSLAELEAGGSVAETPAQTSAPAATAPKPAAAKKTEPAPAPAPAPATTSTSAKPQATTPWGVPVVQSPSKRPLSLREIQEQEALRAKDAPASLGPASSSSSEGSIKIQGLEDASFQSLFALTFQNPPAPESDDEESPRGKSAPASNAKASVPQVEKKAPAKSMKEIMEEEEKSAKKAPKQQVQPKPAPAKEAAQPWAKTGPAKSLAEIQAEELKLKQQEDAAQQQRDKAAAAAAAKKKAATKSSWTGGAPAPAAKGPSGTAPKSLREIQEEELKQQRQRQQQQAESAAQQPKQAPTRLAGAWSSPTTTRQDISLKQIQDEQQGPVPSSPSAQRKPAGTAQNSWAKPSAGPAPTATTEKPLAASNDDESFWDYEETPEPTPAPAKTILAKPSAAKKPAGGASKQGGAPKQGGQPKRGKTKRTLDPSMLGFSVEGGPISIDADDS